MGVTYLTKYVKQNEKIFYKSHVVLKGCYLVFDGDALMWSLFRRNKIPHHYGGDYNALYFMFLKFFKDLKRHGVHAYLVLDGGLNIPMKNETLCKRKLQYIKSVKRLNAEGYASNLPMPLLCRMVFMETLRDAGVEFAVAQVEADLLVVAVANKLGCAAVTNDSDFFLLDVQHGVVNLDLLLDIVQQMPASNLKCSIYHRTHLLSHLKLRESMIHFLAVLMGNDYSVNEYLKSWRETTGVALNCGKKLLIEEQITTFTKYLTQFTQVEDVVTSLCGGVEGMESSMRKELDEYDLSVVTEECEQLCHALKSPMNLSEIFVLPSNECVNLLNRFGYLSSCCIDIINSLTHYTDVQCENLSRKSSSGASEELRMYIYRLLLMLRDSNHGNQEICIEEFKRASDAYKSYSVTINMDGVKNLQAIRECSVEDKRDIFFQLIGFPKELLDDVEAEAALFILAAYHWTHFTVGSLGVTPYHAKALLGSFLICRHNSGQGLSFASKEIKTRLDMDAAHLLCIFQSILFYVMFLNTLLGHPFVNQSARFMVGGSCYHRFYEKLCEGYPSKNLLKKSELNSFNIYLDIITKNTGDRFVAEQQPQPQKDKLASKTNQSAKATPGVKKDLGNKFAALCMDDECDNEESDSDE